MKLIPAFFITCGVIFTVSPRTAYCESPVAKSTQAESAIYPVFLADLPNPNDFSLFANGGWDGSWYVGYNTCWIQKIVVPQGNYKKAYIGVKLGRMKSVPVPGSPPWEKKAIPGEIYVAVSSTPSWTRKQSYFLVSSEDIPLEPDPENAVEGAGEAKWFYTEVPLKLINTPGDNFIAVWSPTNRLNAISNSPVLAAGWGTKEVDTWLNNNIKGMPPASSIKTVSTPITVFEPAIALKLIPASAPTDRNPRVAIFKIEDGKAIGKIPAPKVVWSAVEGQSIERSWVEISTDAKTWNRYGRYAWSAPYCFTLKTNEITMTSEGKAFVRVGAADIFENTGFSPEKNIFEVKEQ